MSNLKIAGLGLIAALKKFADTSGVKLLSDGPTETAKLQVRIQSDNVTWDEVGISDLTPDAYC
jgi:putative spermidine/putrescine transport system substrate-binding protein